MIRHNEVRPGATRFMRQVALPLAVVLLLASCGKHQGSAQPVPPAGTTTTAPATSTTTPATTTPTTTTTTSRPDASATERLEAFVATARTTDRQLRVTARLINGGIGRTSLHFTAATFAAIRGIDPVKVARTIPAGLPRPLAATVYLVFSDIVSRRYAYSPVLDLEHSGRVSRTDERARLVFEGLAHGSRPAARFPKDLAAVQATAKATASWPTPAADSRAAATVSVYTALVIGHNGGCAGSGGWLMTTPPPIAWTGGRDDHHLTGSVTGVRFRSAFAVGTGWTTIFDAC